MHERKKTSHAGIGRGGQRQWRQHVTTLRSFAEYIRLHATSHRNFQVGTAALVWSSVGVLGLLGGPNRKAQPGPRRPGIDFCAEMIAILIAKAIDARKIVGMVTVASPQADDVSGQNFGVTVSCYHCRGWYRKELQDPASPLKGDTRLRFVDHANPTTHLEFSVDEFLAMFTDDPPYEST